MRRAVGYSGDDNQGQSNWPVPNLPGNSVGLAQTVRGLGLRWGQLLLLLPNARSHTEWDFCMHAQMGARPKTQTLKYRNGYAIVEDLVRGPAPDDGSRVCGSQSKRDLVPVCECACAQHSARRLCHPAAVQVAHAVPEPCLVHCLRSATSRARMRLRGETP